MKKNFLSIKIGTVLSVFLCFIAAVLFWLFVKYSEANAIQAMNMLSFDCWSWQ